MKFNKVGVSDKADISANTTIEKDVFIGAFTSIEEGVLIHTNVKIQNNLENTQFATCDINGMDHIFF